MQLVSCACPALPTKNSRKSSSWQPGKKPIKFILYAISRFPMNRKKLHDMSATVLHRIECHEADTRVNQSTNGLTLSAPYGHEGSGRTATSSRLRRRRSEQPIERVDR